MTFDNMIIRTKNGMEITLNKDYSDAEIHFEYDTNDCSCCYDAGYTKGITLNDLFEQVKGNMFKKMYTPKEIVRTLHEDIGAVVYKETLKLLLEDKTTRNYVELFLAKRVIEGIENKEKL